MAFKTMKSIQKELFGNKLVLDDDGKSVKGVFLYNSDDDVLVASAHYIKTESYSGYVHCCETGCPACANGIRKQDKLFIPFLILADLNPDMDLESDKLVFWDRSNSFMHQLNADVFDRYPDPSRYVFKITRHGAWKDRNTRYEISVVMNFNADINDVLSSMGIKFPDAYERVIRDMSPSEMSDALSTKQSQNQAYKPESSFSYKAMPRKHFTDPEDLSIKSDDELPGEEVQLSPMVGSFEVKLNKHDDASELSDYIPSKKNVSESIEHIDSIDASDAEDDEFEPEF